MTNQRLIERLESFWNGYDSVLEGEWNTGLNEDDWKLLEDVKQALTDEVKSH